MNKEHLCQELRGLSERTMAWRARVRHLAKLRIPSVTFPGRPLDALLKSECAQRRKARDFTRMHAAGFLPLGQLWI